MAFLMHIGFDNSSRLIKNVYYFEYNGVKFKLIQSRNKKWLNQLITIIPGFINEMANKVTYTIAVEYLSALCWQNNSTITVSYLGGMGIPENYRLRNAKGNFLDFSMVANNGFSIGFDIDIIPKIQTEKQRNALILFREAMSSNSNYLSFLFYWQILEINNRDPIGWINKIYKNQKNKFNSLNSEFSEINIAGKSLGHYFYDDCRNAIAHIINRKPGKTKFLLDSLDDKKRLAISTRTIERFAKIYIKEELQLKNYLYLKSNGKEFPIYN